MAFEFNFKEAYGKDFDKMSPDERMMALMGKVYFMERHLAQLNSKTRCIPRLQRLSWGISIALGSLVAWLSWLSLQFINHITMR